MFFAAVVEKQKKRSASFVWATICRLTQLDIDLRGGLALYSKLLSGARSLKVGLKRESGENPELPRSGKQERTLQVKHWSSHGLGSWSK
jgi:hypothetical protein